jgi:hypothetical protein
MFGPDTEEVARRRKLHNEELHHLNSSPNIVRVIKWTKYEIGETYNTHGGNWK